MNFRWRTILKYLGAPTWYIKEVAWDKRHKIIYIGDSFIGIHFKYKKIYRREMR